MPSGMIQLVDGPPIYGMNSIDDPKTLKPGECVKLVNAFPGNPPRPRNGCTGLLLSGSTPNMRFVPPGISFEYNNILYALVWVYDSSTSKHVLSAVRIVDGVFTQVALSEFALGLYPLFDMLEVHGNVYTSTSENMTTWKSSSDGAGSNHKVIESPTVVRDMCISYAGSAAGLAYGAVNGVLNSGKYVEYSFQYVRRNDAEAFEAGGAISGILLPPNITAGYRPKRIDTYLPGACIGVEDISNRRVLQLVETSTTPSSSMLSTGAAAEAVGSFNATQCVDGNTATTGFNVDAATAGAWVRIDFGAANSRCIEKLDMYMSGAGSTNNFKLQYSDNASSWTDCSPNTVLSAAGWNSILSTATAPHRYWRIYLVDSGTAGPDIMELRAFGKISVEITLNTSDTIAYLQGATHLRVCRSLEQNSAELAQAATKYFLADLPIQRSNTPPLATAFMDTTSNATLEGESNQLITGYTEAPAAAFMEYVKGRLYLMAKDGKVYFSESVGGDGGTDLDKAQSHPQAWASLFNPINYLLDCDYADGQLASGIKRLSDDLFMFKERKIFALFGSDPLNTPISQVSNVNGCAFPYTITKCEIKGMFGKCILFLSNDGPMVLEEGGRLRAFSEFKIKELWPEYSKELYSALDTEYDWIVHNCTATFFKNTWWVMYKLSDGTSKIFGYYFDPDLVKGAAPNGPFTFKFAEF